MEISWNKSLYSPFLPIDGANSCFVYHVSCSSRHLLSSTERKTSIYGLFLLVFTGNRLENSFQRSWSRVFWAVFFPQQ